MGEADWERARITQGRPAAGAELTEDYNPYEAGLCHAVSLDKGCYIGQETLAKVNNQKVLLCCRGCCLVWLERAVPCCVAG
jgi:folate-binding protein YgfZ